MQFFWLWIDDFVGKGLDAGTILKFIWYQSAVLIPLALPLSVLLSSLMTFGNLGESFELVAIKSAGISLMRFMRPLFIVAGCIAFGAFLFSNYVIPVANLKSRTLLADIVLAKPAFAIKEGVFFDGIDKFAIKIGKKEANDSIIRDVIVYQSGDNSLQDAFLIARDGVMKPSADKHFLDIVFKNGWRYEERGGKEDSTTDYIRLGFKEYKMQMDISSFKFTKTDDSANVNNERMYNMRQLDVAIDSISKFNGEIAKNFEATIYANFMILNYRDSITKDIKIPDSILNFKANIDAYMGVKKDSTKAEKDSARARAKLDSARHKLKADSLKRVARKDSIRLKRIADSTRRKARRDSIKMGLKPLAPPPPQRNGNRDSLKNKRADTATKPVISAKDTAKNKRDTSTAKKDSVAKAAAKAKPVKKDPNSFTALLPDSARQQIQDRALTSLESFRNNLEMNGNNIVEQEKTLQKYKIEWHKKIALALACIVLFMIGAPLGSIIRKGGLGTPMIFAIIFFMIFYFVSTRGEKLAKEMEMSAFSGMWLSTFVLVPVGVFLIYKAMHDSNLFNKEFYTRLKRKVLKKLGKES